jgi:hypothetical protein
MLHITFTWSGSGFLRQALRQMGVRQRVKVFPDDLSFGPIDPDDPEKRRVWAEANLRPPDDTLSPSVELPPLPPLWDGSRSIADETKEFWASALGAEACTVWFTPRVPSEYCGFLAWLERAGAKPYNVVDVTNERFSVDRKPVFGLGHADPAQFDYQSCIARAAPLEPEAREDYLRLWKALRGENAALRVLIRGSLVSAPIDFFDEVILSRVPSTWRKVGWVAGDVSAALWDEHTRQGNDKIIMSRLFALAEARRIECKGDLSEWRRSCEIRKKEAVGR